ncbi:MAG: hypothetical protein PHE83_05825 [Opitutaceae bacterium]|nr:hypothetical protein [Opitutaceae bacterium]
MSKRRGDSKLWTLPAPVQTELYALCSGEGGYAAGREWLQRQHGLLVRSDGTFSRWWAAYPFSLPAATDFAQTFERELTKLPEMEGQADKISRLGQVGFEMMALRNQNLEGYAMLKKLRLKEAEQKLVERRVAILEKKAAQADAAKQVTDEPDLTPEERLQRYRQIFGGG